MDALKEVSKVWLVAKMVHTLFESILGNKHLEERLQKAAGKRHQKNKQTAPQPPPKPVQEATKRKLTIWTLVSRTDHLLLSII